MKNVVINGKEIPVNELMEKVTAAKIKLETEIAHLQTDLNKKKSVIESNASQPIKDYLTRIESADEQGLQQIYEELFDIEQKLIEMIKTTVEGNEELCSMILK